MSGVGRSGSVHREAVMSRGRGQGGVTVIYFRLDILVGIRVACSGA